MTDLRQKLQSYQGNTLDPVAQEALNTPLSGGVADEHQKYLALLIEKIEKKEIDLMQPESLINQEVYAKLAQNIQGKTDLIAMNLASSLRQIWKLHKTDKIDDNNYQMKALLEQVWLMKEGVEKEYGNVFKI